MIVPGTHLSIRGLPDRKKIDCPGENIRYVGSNAARCFSETLLETSSDLMRSIQVRRVQPKKRTAGVCPVVAYGANIWFLGDDFVAGIA